VTVLQDTCPGLVQQIEAGQLNSDATRSILEQSLLPMLAQKIDTVVLGCTHYPFVIPLIEDIVGPDVRVIDPAPAVARQARRLLQTTGMVSTGPDAGWVRYITTGDLDAFRRLLPSLTQFNGQVEKAAWVNGKILQA
jgi:glutamate racemase